MMKKIKIILGGLAALALATGYLLQPKGAVDESVILKELAPDAAFAEKAGTPPYYRIGDGKAAAFNSYDVTPGIRGYAGPIKVMILLDEQGVIRGLRLIEHRETKNYVHHMESPAYLNRLVGKSVRDRFEVDKDIDGISRATVSVEALAKTVRDSSRIVASTVYGIDTKEEETAVAGWGRLWYAALFAVSLSGYALTRSSKGHQRYRDGVLLAGILIIGFMLSSPFSILHVFNLALFQPSSSVLWLVVVISTLVSLAFLGRFYCGWLCPFGALSEYIGRLPARKWTLPAKTDNAWRNLKYVLLGLVVVVVFVSRKTEYGNYEAYVTLFSFHGNVLTWALVVVALAANLRVERFWCRYLCPVAAFLGLLSKQTPGYPGITGCPMGNNQGPQGSECIRCNRCYAPGVHDAGKTPFQGSRKDG